MELPTPWELVTDRVMGGVSNGHLQTCDVLGRAATRLTGEVSLDNNGGFVQMAFDVADGQQVCDASAWTGVEIDVIGNDETYDIRLRTTDISRPWQSFRADFYATRDWETLRIPFSAFHPHKTEAPFDPAKLRRIGILAIGREFSADIAVAAVRFYA